MKSFTTPGLKVGQARFPSTRSVAISDVELARHVALTGDDDCLRRGHLIELLAAQAQRGKGWLFVARTSNNDSTLAKLESAAKLAGRGEDFFVIDLSDPSRGHAYKPLLEGTAARRATRLSAAVLPPHTPDLCMMQFLTFAQALYAYADRHESVLSLEALVKVLEQPERVVPMLLQDEEVRQVLDTLGLARAGTVDSQAWAHFAVEPLKALRNFVANGGIAYDRGLAQVSIREVFTANRMCVVLVPEGPAEVANQVLHMLLAETGDAMLTRGALPKDIRNDAFVFAIDELWDILDSLAIHCRGVLAAYPYARSFGVGLVYSFSAWTSNIRSAAQTQQRGAIWGNTWTKISHGTSSEIEQQFIECTLGVPGVRAKLASLRPGYFMLNTPERAIAGRMVLTLREQAQAYRKTERPAIGYRPALMLLAPTKAPSTSQEELQA